jgi:hypothetical protein
VSSYRSVRSAELKGGTGTASAIAGASRPERRTLPLYSHWGDKFIHMISRTLEIWLDELECHMLQQRDSFWSLERS